MTMSAFTTLHPLVQASIEASPLVRTFKYYHHCGCDTGGGNPTICSFHRGAQWMADAVAPDLAIAERAKALDVSTPRSYAFSKGWNMCRAAVLGDDQ